MTVLLRRDIPVLDGNGHFNRDWYNALINTQKSTDGLVSGVTIYTDVGVVNAMQIQTGLAPAALIRSLTRYVKPAFTNTSTAVTLNDTGTGAKPVKLGDGSLPAVGQIQAGVTLQLQYDGAAWEILNLSTADQTIPGNVTVGGNATVDGNEHVVGTLQVDGLATLKTVDSTVVDEAANALPIGFKGKPQVIQNAHASFALSDRSKHWYHSDGSAYTWTIPANGSIAFPVGTEIDLVCAASAAASITLAITTDTLTWLPTGGTGSRTLGQYARAKLIKVAATRWTIDGVGIT
jgi:hypothetical protein